MQELSSKLLHEYLHSLYQATLFVHIHANTQPWDMHEEQANQFPILSDISTAA